MSRVSWFKKLSSCGEKPSLWAKKRVQSFGYAFSGLATLIKTQPHAKFHIFAAFIVLSAAGYLQIARSDWLIIILLIALVIAFEALNTAIEFLADAVHPEHHPLVGQCKDVAAAAVLVISVGAAVVGLIVFYPYLVQL